MRHRCEAFSKLETGRMLLQHSQRISKGLLGHHIMLACCCHQYSILSYMAHRDPITQDRRPPQRSRATFRQAIRRAGGKLADAKETRGSSRKDTLEKLERRLSVTHVLAPCLGTRRWQEGPPGDHPHPQTSEQGRQRATVEPRCWWAIAKLGALSAES